MPEPTSKFPESDPRHHTAKLKGRLQELAQHMRADIAKIDEPRAQALFETSAEVLGALAKALDDYERGEERAFKQAPK